MFDWLLTLVDETLKKAWYLVGTTYFVLIETYKRDIVMCNAIPPIPVIFGVFKKFPFLQYIFFLLVSQHFLHLDVSCRSTFPGLSTLSNSINPALLSKLMQSTEFYIDLLNNKCVFRD